MELLLKILWYLLIFVLAVGLCFICADSVFADTNLASAEEISLALSEEEADFLVRSAAFAAKGSMHTRGKNDSRPAASYAARVGIIATVLNRMADPRFPDSIPWIITSDKTFSPAACAVRLTDRELALTKAALEAALAGFDPTGGALYFSTPTTWCNPFAVTCQFDGYSFGIPRN